MTQNKTAAALAVPAALVLLIVIAAKASVPLLIEMTLLLPVAAAMLQYSSGWPGAAAVCAAAGLACGFILPADLLPVTVLWCGGSLLAAVIPVRKPLIRPILWAAVRTPGPVRCHRGEDHRRPGQGRVRLYRCQPGTEQHPDQRLQHGPGPTERY